MRKILLLGAAALVLFLGSLSLGVAAALTGAPVFYDARSPHPVGTADDRLGAEAGAATTSPGTSDGADDGDGAAPPLTQSPVPVPPSPSADPSPEAPTPSPAPSPSTPPADPLPTTEEQAAWLAFQQAVRECMVDAGYEYRHWEWWTTEPRNPTSTAPAMPVGLSAAEQAAWHAALEGPGLDGTGCLGEAAEQDREESAPPPPASPEPSVPPAPEEGQQRPEDATEEVAPEALESDATEEVAPEVVAPEVVAPDATAPDADGAAGASD
ncbi:hypothetical protein [Agromyces lapidis]|uniref:Uncharacterized protein n=1 Tax=Agromyces lapidis TaxID=279574 RepID=A0ABV5SKX0_9MICO|nr:hypothetical protein [Agromyces lapidis]